MQRFSVVVVGKGGARERREVTASGIEDAARTVAVRLYGTRGTDAGVYRTSGQIGEPGAFRAYYRCRGCRRMAHRDSLRVEGVNGGN